MRLNMLVTRSHHENVPTIKDVSNKALVYTSIVQNIEVPLSNTFALLHELEALPPPTTTLDPDISVQGVMRRHDCDKLPACTVLKPVLDSFAPIYGHAIRGPL